MIKILIPQEKRNGKTTARGFWKSESGRVCYDYLRVEQGEFALERIKSIASTYNQLAVFFANEGEGFIYNRGTNKIEVLSQRKQLIVSKKDLRYFIKLFLRKYSGVTAYIKED